MKFHKNKLEYFKQVYDVGNMLAEAGGNVGLLLGFSLLSILLYVMKCCKMILKALMIHIFS
jgi:hypothetical protein